VKEGGKAGGQAKSSSCGPSATGNADQDKLALKTTVLSRVEAIRELANRANRGSEEALACLRQLLDSSPEIWDLVGDLARHAELAWVGLVAGEDRLMQESVKKRIAKLKDELAGASATTMERLLVDRVVTSWLAVAHAETRAASPGNCSPAQLTERLRAVESAQRRHLTAIKVLAKLRATVPQGFAPLNLVRLFSADRHQA
jgi:hypothetical protein